MLNSWLHEFVIWSSISNIFLFKRKTVLEDHNWKSRLTFSTVSNSWLTYFAEACSLCNFFGRFEVWSTSFNPVITSSLVSSHFKGHAHIGALLLLRLCDGTDPRVLYFLSSWPASRLPYAVPGWSAGGQMLSSLRGECHYAFLGYTSTPLSWVLIFLQFFWFFLSSILWFLGVRGAQVGLGFKLTITIFANCWAFLAL